MNEAKKGIFKQGQILKTIILRVGDLTKKKNVGKSRKNHFYASFSEMKSKYHHH